MRVTVAASLLLHSCAAWQHVQLPMRDGVKLNTNINFPIAKFEGKKLTTIIDRSPYTAFGTELLADIGLPLGFAAVRQDMRGTAKSGGNFSMWAKAADDAYDTMEWISTQKWSDGNVIMMGGSADGLCTIAAVYDQPPWMKQQFIIFSSGLGYPVIYPGGAYRKSLADFWLDATVPHAAAAAKAEVRANEMPGKWWDARMNITGRCGNVNFPSIHWGGWYDIFLYGQLYTFECYQRRSALPGRAKLVIDPLGHCQDGSKYFKNDLNGGDLIFGRVALPILLAINQFEDKNSTVEGVKDVTFYVMGPDVQGAMGNYWTSLDEFPVATPTPLYFAEDGALVSSAPTKAASQGFVYDPAHPVPTTGGNNLNIPCGPLDQRPVENRSDVLLFTTDPYSEPVALTGAIDAVIWVASNCTDTDFTVKLSDVHPDGTSRLLQDGIVRMRWREGQYAGATPQLMTPGKTYRADVTLWNTSYIINSGHRIRVAVSSSNSPRFEPNPNTGKLLVQNDTEKLIALNTLHTGGNVASHINLPVVPLSQLPKHGGILAAEDEWAHGSVSRTSTLAALRDGRISSMIDSWKR